MSAEAKSSGKAVATPKIISLATDPQLVREVLKRMREGIYTDTRVSDEVKEFIENIISLNAEIDNLANVLVEIYTEDSLLPVPRMLMDKTLKTRMINIVQVAENIIRKEANRVAILFEKAISPDEIDEKARAEFLMALTHFEEMTGMMYIAISLAFEKLLLIMSLNLPALESSRLANLMLLGRELVRMR